MDYGIAIKNPVAGHSSYIDEKAKGWGNVEADILSYLSDVSNLESFANMANDAEQLASYVDAFIENARTYFESMQKISEGQVEWTELRKKFGSTVAKSIAKIRKLNAEFGSEMETIDAQDRASMLKIEQKRKHAIAEIAADLNSALQMELFRHQNKISSIELRNQANQERQGLQQQLREKRQELLNRAKYGSRQNALPSDRIPVMVHQNSHHQSAVSPSGRPGFWQRLWAGFGNR